MCSINKSYVIVTNLLFKADAAYHNQVSLLAIVTVMNIICSKRWQKAVNGNSDPPENLKVELRKAMTTSRDLGLSMPAKLQAVAAKYCGVN